VSGSEHGLHLVEFANVCRNGKCADTKRLDPGGGRLGTIRMKVVYDYTARIVLGQYLCRSQADTLACTRYEGHPARQVEVVSHWPHLGFTVALRG
jgi:hypothetical protein